MSIATSLPSIDFSLIHPLKMDNNKLHEMFVLRDDLIHPVISGNKWRKLKYVVDRVRNEKLKGIISYGGAFSNHIMAVACASKIFGFEGVINVRGDELSPFSNDVLRYCSQQGARLQFLSRSEYDISKNFYGLDNTGEYLIIPEGGACYEGFLGALEIVNNVSNYDIIALAQGTTTTSLGVLLAAPPCSEVWVFPVLKNFNSIFEMEKLAHKFGRSVNFGDRKKQLKVFDQYHFGGYAKNQSEVRSRLNKQYSGLNLPLDPIYNGKAFLGMIEELGKITTRKKVLFIHTGGLWINA
jgi:1-aminocyclopropane-1-carboxylate deaminase